MTDLERFERDVKRPKRCARCGESKPPWFFFGWRRAPDRRSAYCKQCQMLAVGRDVNRDPQPKQMVRHAALMKTEAVLRACSVDDLARCDRCDVIFPRGERCVC